MPKACDGNAQHIQNVWIDTADRAWRQISLSNLFFKRFSCIDEKVKTQNTYNGLPKKSFSNKDVNIR